MAISNNGKPQSSENSNNDNRDKRSRKPGMPSVGAVNNARKGGLGRGLGALIPTGTARPSLGNGAADVILGGNSPSGKVARSAQTPSPEQTTASNAKRHSDVNQSARSKGPTTKNSIKNADGNGDNLESFSAEKVGNGSSDQIEQTSGFGATYREINIEQIRTNAKQPRSVFEEEALRELEHSIREFGLMQPIVVREAPLEDSRYELIMGERRLRASRRAGLKVIPAIIRQTEDEDMLRDALLENIHRVQLNPLEEAAAYQQLLEEFNVTQAELGQRIGRSRPRITNMIRLLQLPVGVQRRVAAGVLSSGHARALLGVKAGAEVQESLANRIVSEGMSVRATEEAVLLLNRMASDNDKTVRGQGSKPPLPPHVNHWVDDISEALETKVSVQMGKKKGKIVVEFSGPDDFDRIVEILKFQQHD